MKSLIKTKENKFSLGVIFNYDPADLFKRKAGQAYQIEFLQATPSGIRRTELGALFDQGNHLLTRRKRICVQMTQGEQVYTLLVNPYKDENQNYEVAETQEEAMGFLQEEAQALEELGIEDTKIVRSEPYLISDYNIINEEQMEILKDFVKGEEIYDLCSGNNTIARLCCYLGAEKVTTIDITTRPNIRKVDQFPPSRYNIAEEFYDLSLGFPPGRNITRAIIASPPPFHHTNAMPKWEEILPQIPHILYFGGNTKEAHPCGNPKFWAHLIGREITAVRVRDVGAVIEYGPNPRKGYQVLREEALGLIQAGFHGKEHSNCIGQSQAKELMELLQIRTSPA